jgi:hypothetical protein
MEVKSEFVRAPASYSPTKPTRVDDPENLVFLAFDPRSPFSFLQRLGLMLWLVDSGRNGLWL